MSGCSSEPKGGHAPPGQAEEWRGGGEVVVLSVDLFFGMRIRTSLRQLGYGVAIVGGADAFTRAMTGADAGPVLGIVDFNAPVDWEQLQPAIASAVPVIAFGPHTDVAGFRAAKAAGVARVVSNGEFSRTLPALAKRHALPSGSSPA